MTTESKTNSGRPYLAIWLIHIIVYYFFYFTIREFVQNYYLEWDYFGKESTQIMLLSPLLGLMGWGDYFPGFAFLPLFIMYGLYKKIFTKDLFKSFVYSIIGSYILDYIYLVIIGMHKYKIGIAFENDKKNTLFFMIPALSMSIWINYLVFKKTYKRLKMEN